MEFKDFLSKISQIKTILSNKSYEINDFQSIMTPKERLNYNMDLVKNPKKAAVLAFFYPKKNKTFFLLTLRANYKGAHASQISFPGGKKDKIDTNLIETALRESFEEVNIEKESVSDIIKLSKLYIPPSNFWVFPYVGISKSKPNFINNYEVEKLIEVDIDDLLNNNNITNSIITTSYAKDMNVPCFLLNNHIVWGATAMILSEIKELIKLTYDKV